MLSKLNKYGTEAPPFSAAISTETLLFVSGQGGVDPNTGEVPADDLENQTLITVQNIQNILAQSGLTLKDVVKVNVYLTNRQYYGPFNRIYSQLFPQPFPARTVVYCDLNFDLLVEIDVIAKLKDAGRWKEE